MKALFLLPLLAAGCSYSVHQVYMGDFSPYAKGGKKLLVMKEQTRILDITTENRYVEEAYDELKRKCPNGEIIGVSAEFMTAHHFFHAKDRIYLKGRCLGEGGNGKTADAVTPDENVENEAPNAI